MEDFGMGGSLITKYVGARMDTYRSRQAQVTESCEYV
jgi:hypothetical protein